jgi:hypothetical protein
MARRQEVAVVKAQPLRICSSDLECYRDFLTDEEERQVAHAMKVSTADAAPEALNGEICEESRRFEEAR